MPPKKKKTLSREETLQKKREAEKRRYQRLKDDPQKREELKEKERLKYQKKKEKGLRKLVKDMNPREHRAAKKKWKEHCAVYRSKQKGLKDMTNTFLRENTPVSEPELPPPRPASSNQSENRKRRAKKQREKLNKQKDMKIAALKKKLEKYKKRLLRLETGKKQCNSVTPNTKLKRMLDTPEAQKEVVKKALFGEVLNDQLKENYSKLKTNRDKQMFSKVISGNLVEKYKIWRHKSSAVSYKRVKKSKLMPSSLEVPKPTRRDKISDQCMREIREFFEDDSNSRMGAGKKEYLTRNNVRKQKRYLLETMQDLHKKFVSDNFNISYSTFCRLRPFWVVKPRAQDRDTCLCVVHSNIDLKLCALHNAKILPYCKHQKLLENVCCDRYNVECLSRRCQNCINKTPDYKEFDDSKCIKYKKWIAERQEIHDIKTKKTRIVTKYLKKTYDIHPRKLITDLHDELEDKFFVHQSNYVHQHNAMDGLKEDLKKNLSEEDVLIHMDFSENYCTKYGEEIQAFHFGGSRVQLSLHTVVVYFKKCNKSYCTVSKNISHSPAAIWIHLRPIFKTLPSGIKRIHFFSDGPVTQYRNKTMFYILASRLSQEIPSVERFSWNYSESGHGKGAPDGVGATCKRTADSIVYAGGDVDDFEKFVEVIQKRCPGVTCITIDDQDIQNMTDIIQKETSSLKSFFGTLKVHQVTGTITSTILGLTSDTPMMLTMRSLSCFCNSDTCDHYKIGTISYDPKLKLTVDDVFTDSDSEHEIYSADPKNNTAIVARDNAENDNVAGSSAIVQPYNIGDFILVKFPVRNVEYRYAAVINEIDNEENELRVTFLKVCDDKGQTFKVDENDVSDISFDQIVNKLENPNLVLKGKRMFYKFSFALDIFEK